MTSRELMGSLDDEMLSTTYPKIPSSTAVEAGKEPGLKAWVTMATVTLGGTARGIEGRRREWRQTHQKKRGRIEKRGWKSLWHRLFFSSWS